MQKNLEIEVPEVTAVLLTQALQCQTQTQKSTKTITENPKITCCFNSQLLLEIWQKKETLGLIAPKERAG